MRAHGRTRRLLIGAAACAALGGGLASAGSAGSVPARGAQAAVMVTASDNSFGPRDVTITVGGTVTWVNQGSNNHDVKFNDENVSRPPMPGTGWTVSRTFSAPGTFTYFCTVHGNANGTGMAGTVTVNPAPAPGPPPPPPPPPPGGGGGNPTPGGPGQPTPTNPSVSLKLSDATPQKGQRVRFTGSVKPELDGQVLQIQRKVRRGSFKTVATTQLRDAGTTRSKYSRRVRIAKDGVFRSRLPAGNGHAGAVSRTKHVNVH